MAAADISISVATDRRRHGLARPKQPDGLRIEGIVVDEESD